jgi:hypothetical protein
VNPHPFSADKVRQFEFRCDPANQRYGVIDVGSIFEQHGELVPTESGHGVSCAQTFLETGRDIF